MPNMRNGKKGPLLLSAVILFGMLGATASSARIPSATAAGSPSAASGGSIPMVTATATSAASGSSATEEPAWTKYRIFAHALGSIDGLSYTNTYEAFLEHYAEGQRLFETDLTPTTDGRIAAVHDWVIFNHFDDVETYRKQGVEVPLSMKEFKATKVAGHLHTLSLDDLVLLMQRYPDIYLDLDSKTETNEETRQLFQQVVDAARKTDPSVLDRMIPELFNPEMYREVLSIYPFPNVLYSIYKTNATPAEVVDFVSQNGVKTVAMPVERATPDYMSALREAGALTYVHTVNDPAEWTKLLEMGVHGIYSDSLPEPVRTGAAAYSDHGDDTVSKRPSWLAMLTIILYKLTKGTH